MGDSSKTSNRPELETLGYKPGDKKKKHPYRAPPATLGFNSHVIKPEIRVNKTEIAEEPSEQPIEYPEMDENTKLIVFACQQVVRSAKDYNDETFTTPITVVQACEQLSHLITRIKKVQRAKEQRAADNAMTEGF